LLATEGYVSQAAMQYADIPLAFYILSSVTLAALAAARDWPPVLTALAGVFAGFAAWTKNEGLPFVALMCAVALWQGRWRAMKWLAAGAAPAVILTIVFKLTLVEGREAMFPLTIRDGMKMIADPGRWGEIIGSFTLNFWGLGFPWAHPFLLMAIAAWALGFARKQWWLLAAPLGLLAADFGIYLISATGLTWHLGTSNSRVIVQVWPAVLLGFFSMLRDPATVQPEGSARVKKRKGR
jgi:hypothetical protein